MYTCDVCEGDEVYTMNGAFAIVHGFMGVYVCVFVQQWCLPLVITTPDVVGDYKVLTIL